MKFRSSLVATAAGLSPVARAPRLAMAARRGNARPASAAFTLIEVVITITLTVMLVGVLMIFSEGTGRALLSITTQTSDNQAVGNGVEFILSRIRLANTASNDATGNILTLSFDDDPDTDTEDDGVTWNDKDHYEQFIYMSQDPSFTTLNDNLIIYKPDIAAGATNTIVPSYVRKLSNQPIFAVSNSTVMINFGLLTTNSTPFSQAIEIRTKVTLRNKTS